MLTVTVLDAPQGFPMADQGTTREEGIGPDKSTLRLLADAAEVFIEVSPTLPITQVHMFLTVALNEGLSLTELAEITDLKKSTASRYLLDLSDKTRAGGNGFGLVKRETDPQELRRNMYSLSPAGRNLVKRITSKRG